MILNIGIYCDTVLAPEVELWMTSLAIPEASLFRLKGIFGEEGSLETTSLSMQLRFPDQQALNDWVAYNLKKIYDEMYENFGEQAMMMPTVLEEF